MSDIQIFQDNILEIARDKRRVELKELLFLLDRYETTRYIRKHRFVRNMKNRGIPRRDWNVYWVISQKINDMALKKKIAQLRVELNNVFSAEKAVLAIMSGHELLNTERANQHPIQDLYVGQLKRAGSRLRGKCPFHNETNDSFFVFPENNYYCFGCGAYGDAIDFYMKTRGVNFVRAVKEIS